MRFLRFSTGRDSFRGTAGISALLALALGLPAGAQHLLKSTDGSEVLTILPSDLTVLESDDARQDLPCTVSQRKPDLGFDLRFHAGYDVTIPMQELAGDGDLLTVVMRVFTAHDKAHPAYFVQHYTVPAIEDDAKGEALLPGVVDVGAGAYHVDWLMRDRAERFCSSSWDMQADLNNKDRGIPLFINQREIAEAIPQPFVNQPGGRPEIKADDQLNVKMLVNFAPQQEASASLQRSDVDALVTILKAIERDPHVRSISLVAFNINETRIVYRQDVAERIDFPALGHALQSVRPGTVTLKNLSKNSETDFLENLIQTEMGSGTHPDAVVFAGPKAMLNADVPTQDLRRIADIECPVFYLNYNLNPQAVPWKDSISHAIRVFKGTEFTISRPRDIWYSTEEMLSRIVQFKHDRGTGSTATAQALH